MRNAIYFRNISVFIFSKGANARIMKIECRINRIEFGGSFELITITANQMLNRIFRVILVKCVLHRNEFSSQLPLISSVHKFG